MSATFRVKYVKKSDRNPEAFAVNLEKLLNELAQDGWSIVRTEYEAKGMLIVAVRQREEERPHPLAELMQMINPPSSNFSPMIAQLIDSVFSKCDNLDHGVDDKAKTIIASVCRKHPTPVLRQAIEEIRKYCEKHTSEDHGGSSCELTKALTNLATGLEKHINQSVV